MSMVREKKITGGMAIISKIKKAKTYLSNSLQHMQKNFFKKYTNMFIAEGVYPF
jgi:hypothetical protein